eukprot:scaffold190016_cov19-Tisochrysis_lutea.AAC.1
MSQAKKRKAETQKLEAEANEGNVIIQFTTSTGEATGEKQLKGMHTQGPFAGKRSTMVDSLRDTTCGMATDIVFLQTVACDVALACALHSSPCTQSMHGKSGPSKLMLSAITHIAHSLSLSMSQRASPCTGAGNILGLTPAQGRHECGERAESGLPTTGTKDALQITLGFPECPVLEL